MRPGGAASTSTAGDKGLCAVVINVGVLLRDQGRRVPPGLSDKKSGRTDDRPELKACHAFLHPGDTLVVPSLDRYGRSLQDLVTMVAELRRRELGPAQS